MTDKAKLQERAAWIYCNSGLFPKKEREALWAELDGIKASLGIKRLREDPAIEREVNRILSKEA